MKTNPTAWRTLRDVFVEAHRLSGRVRLTLVASALAYTTLLSIIPVLAVSFAVFHAFGGLEKLLDTLEPFILSNLAMGTGTEVTQALRGFIENVHADAVGAGGFVGLIITTVILFSSAERAINQVWGIERQRSAFHRFSVYWLLITLGPLALAVALGVATSSDIPVASLLPSGVGITFVTILILFCVYQFAPNRPVDWRCSFLSATLTAALGSLAGFGYEIYTKKAVTYNKIYGSLSALPTLLIWIYIMWLITLSGAALTAALQKKLENQGAPPS